MPGARRAAALSILSIGLLSGLRPEIPCGAALDAKDAKPQPDVAATVSGAGRVVVIGDVHGDFHTFARLLRKSGLVNGSLAWGGGRTVFVQTGDILGRGQESRRVLDLVIRLEREALDAGGRVLFLLGNHEVYNLVGNLSYLHERELDAYAEDEDPGVRRTAVEEMEAFLDARKPLLRSDYYRKLAKSWRREGIESRFPSGYFGHRRLFSPDGRYGKWLLAHDPIAKVDAHLFLHAGLSRSFGKIPFRQLNRKFHEDLQEYFRVIGELVDLGVFHSMLEFSVLRDLLLSEKKRGNMGGRLKALYKRLVALEDGPAFSMSGPIEYRGMAWSRNGLRKRDVRKILAAQGAERVIVGHTRSSEQSIRSRFGGLVYLVDTGLNQERFGGRPQSLELRPGEAPRVLSLD